MADTALATEPHICLVTFAAGLCKISHGCSSHACMCTHVLSLCVLRAWEFSYLCLLGAVPILLMNATGAESWIRREMICKFLEGCDR
jgi:hypothetical protein